MPYRVPPLTPEQLNDGDYPTHYRWMVRALELAEIAGESGEVPVGAVIVGPDGEAIATGENRRQRDQDPTGHAEVVALRAAGAILQDWQLRHCHLYVTLEPCPMCAGAIVQARIATLVYATADPKAGAVRSVINVPDSAASFHRLRVIHGVLAESAQGQLQDWFAMRRAKRQLRQHS